MCIYGMHQWIQKSVELDLSLLIFSICCVVQLVNTLQHTASHCNTLRHTATHCNTPQHTATHCNTTVDTQGVMVLRKQASAHTYAHVYTLTNMLTTRKHTHTYPHMHTRTETHRSLLHAFHMSRSPAGTCTPCSQTYQQISHGSNKDVDIHTPDGAVGYQEPTHTHIHTPIHANTHSHTHTDTHSYTYT